jgi:hypothetical protein
MRLLWRDDVGFRHVQLVLEFIHWRNTAIPPILPVANRPSSRKKDVVPPEANSTHMPACSA